MPSRLGQIFCAAQCELLNSTKLFFIVPKTITGKEIVEVLMSAEPGVGGLNKGTGSQRRIRQHSVGSPVAVLRESEAGCIRAHVSLCRTSWEKSKYAANDHNYNHMSTICRHHPPTYLPTCLLCIRDRVEDVVRQRSRLIPAHSTDEGLLLVSDE